MPGGRMCPNPDLERPGFPYLEGGRVSPEGAE